MEESEAWRRARAGDHEVHNSLVEQYLPLAYYVANRLSVNLPSYVAIEDLVSYGHFGLIDAVSRFDPERGVRFSTFAVQRIRGSILDGLRSQDWAPRRVRRDARKLEQAASALNARLERDPTLEELAEQAGMDVEDVSSLLGEVLTATPVSLNGGASRASDAVSGDASHGGFDHPGYEAVHEDAFETDYRERVAAAIGRLPAQERTLLALHYFEGLPFSTIAALLGVTESRVFQIHANTMRSLRMLATA